MKRYITTAVILALCAMSSIHADDKKKLVLSTSNNAAAVDSVAHLKSLKTLEAKEKNLQKRLDGEMQKRNATFSGASAEVLEEMNDRQDSLCLAIKSQIVDVQLQIRDIRQQHASSFIQAIPTKKADK